MKKEKNKPDCGEQLTMEGFETNENAGRIKALSGGLRKNMTQPERKLYTFLFRRMGIKVVRQKVIDKYIVDFFIPPNLVIELDGSQHFSEKGKAQDKLRDEYLTSQGYTVLRYANSDVKSNFAAVCEDIITNI